MVRIIAKIANLGSKTACVSSDVLENWMIYKKISSEEGFKCPLLYKVEKKIAVDQFAKKSLQSTNKRNTDVVKCNTRGINYFETSLPK
jgi:hypothetical protein